MSRERWPEIKRVFHAALERDPGERTAFLEQACAGDEPLRREVETLLASDAEGLPWLDGPAFEVAAEMLASDPAERAVRRIGPYELIRQLGRGGMGSVYLAERADDEFQQQVAVKLLKPGMDSDDILRRFRQERQILASLDHPHVARLFDGGMAADGVPYFIMEYVEGVPIDRYCDQHGLSLGARLELFRAVCSAVRYAHRHLVVHCDLKPSNILVTAEGVPKLLDFGIAKLLGSEHVPRLGATTAPGLQPMTPEYASPEQVRGERITTASDVYSLGVLLYRLLTGQPPYRFDSRAPRDVERAICEDEPVRPSAAAGPPARAGTLRELRRLRGDLDNVVLMALRKDPARRYGSVEQLSEDLRRHLAGLPVIARPDTWSYRAAKFVRRHRVGVVAAALVALSLLGGIVTTAWQAREARAQRERARVQQLAAERVADFLARLLQEADPYGRSGKAVTVREVLDEGARQIDQELGEQPEIQARMMSTIGVAYRNLGLYDQALPLLETALERRRRVFGEAAPEVAESLNNLGLLLRDRGALAAAETLLREALALRRARLGEDAPEVAGSLDALGSLLRVQGDYAAAEPLLRQALALRRRVLGEKTLEVAESTNNLALLMRSMGDYRAAEPLYRQALALYRELLGEESPEVAISLHNLGGLLRLRGEYDAAERCVRKAVALYRELLGEDHPHVAAGLNTLAVLLKGKGDYDASERAYRDVLELQRRALGTEHPDVARSLNNLAALLAARGDDAAAEPLFVESLAMYRRLLGDRHPEVANPLHHLGLLRHRAGDFSAAESYLREALALRRETLGAEHPSVAISLIALGQVLVDRGEAVQAEDLLRQGLRIREAKLSPGHWRTANARSVLGGCLAALGRYGEAEPWLLQGFHVLAAERGPRHRLTLEAQDRLIALYEAWGKTAEAAEVRALSSGDDRR